MALRLPVAYPIGFFKGSEDLYSKFNGQGTKWQMDIFTAPENKKLFMNPAAMKMNDADGKVSRVTNIFRYDCMDGKAGVKAELQVNTDELWSSTLAYNFDMGGDGHRALASFGYATRNADGVRRIAPGTEKAGSYKDTPLELKYRVTSKDFQAEATVNRNMVWGLNGILSFAGGDGAFGAKVGQGKKGIDLDCGVGYCIDAVRGYLKFATTFGEAPKKVTLLAHPVKAIGGVSCCVKAELDAGASALKNAGATFQAACDPLGGDVKLGVRYEPGKPIGANAALVKKLPNKWVLGVGLGLDDAPSMNLDHLKFGMRLINGSTPLPL